MDDPWAPRGRDSLPIRDQPKSIAVVRMDHLGDHVLGAGVLRAFRTRYPRSRLAVVVPTELADLYTHCPFLDAVVGIPENKHWDNLEMAAFLQELSRRDRFDVVIQPRFCEDYHAAELFCKAVAAPGARIIGFRQSWSPVADYDTNGFFTDLIDAPENLHAAQYASRIVTAVTGPQINAPPEVWFDHMDWTNVANQLGLVPRQFVVIGIGSSVAFKLPSLATYSDLLQHLLSTPYRIVLVGGRHEVGFANAVSATIGNEGGGRIICAAGSLRLPELAALLKKARLYVGPDAGPKHMAAAVRAPVVEICWVPADFPAVSRGPNSAGQCWRPWDTPFRMVHPDGSIFNFAWRQPSYLQQPIPGISSGELRRAVDSILAETSQRALGSEDERSGTLFSSDAANDATGASFGRGSLLHAKE